jgi:short-subunit dehydrogenase
MASSPIALILGAGANIGHHVGRAFAAEGYKIALVARSLKEEDSIAGQLNNQSGFSDGSVVKEFAKVERSLVFQVWLSTTV